LSHTDPRTAQELLGRALEVVAFPKGNVYPLPEDLAPAQRAIAEYLAHHGDLKLHPYAIPGHGETRRRWLGLDPGDALESIMVDGVPLWRALQQVGIDRVRAGAILNALSTESMLSAIGEMYPVAYGLHPTPIVLHGKLRIWSELAGEGAEWAIEQAHKWSALASQSTPRQVPEELKALIFLTLVRAKVPIDPSWDVLLPAGWGARTLKECVRALPEARRGRALLAALEHQLPTTAVDRGLALVDEFPSALLTEAILQYADHSDLPKRLVVEKLRVVAKKHPIVAEALAGEPEPVDLRCTEFFKPARIDDLTEVQREQLRLAGKAWDGKDLAAEDRLAEDGGESSFTGLVQFRTLADMEGKPLFDALLYMGDSGSIYKTGTTERIGSVREGTLDIPDRALKEALQLVLYAPAPMSEPKPAPKKKRAAKPKPEKPEKPEKPKKKAAPKKATRKKKA
jgi:hypothetical protein